jgi:prepilin-type N-terminal cleavage/methylation domain-containing protein
MKNCGHIQQTGGFTLVELLFALAISTILLTGLAGLINGALQSQTQSNLRNTYLADTQFALERIANNASTSHHLILPLQDNPATAWREHVREQFIPAQAPETGSIFASAVLAFCLGNTVDRDRDGWADANNDKDFVDINNNTIREPSEPERIDEDLSSDSSDDNKPGITGIDDDGDGIIDEGNMNDDDEDGSVDEDGIDTLDTDIDGSADEDNNEDMDGDGSGNDDDEDGNSNEDFIDTIAYYLSGSQLIERLPAFKDENADSIVDGRDYNESAIADGVRWFKVERLATNGGAQMVAITLSLGDDEFSVQLSSQFRIGGH